MNLGFGGSEVRDSTHFAKRLVVPLEPKTVVLYAGDNDLSAGRTPEQVQDDFRDFVAKVHADLPKARVLFVAVKPSPKCWAIFEAQRRANNLVKAVCLNDERLEFVDVVPAMLGADGKPIAELFVKDELHLSRKGVQGLDRGDQESAGKVTILYEASPSFPARPRSRIHQRSLQSPRTVRMSRFVLLILAVTALAPVARAAEPSVALVSTPDVVYATVGGESLQLDFVAPKDGGPHPCVVLLHGGAWKFGSRKDLSTPPHGRLRHSRQEPDRDPRRAGVRGGQRQLPVRTRRDKFPAQIEDAKTAVRFLRANAAKFNIDPDRIAAMGFSAGGHLAALLGTTDKSAGFDGDAVPRAVEPGAVRGGLLRPGRPDPVLRDAGAREDLTSCRCSGGRSRDKPELYKKASPIEHVSKDDPPFLILHGNGGPRWSR